MKETKKQYFINVNGEKVEVTKEVYQVYYHGQNKEDDFAKSDIRNDVFYYSGLDTDEFSGEDILVDEKPLPVEEQVILSEDFVILEKALQSLDEKEMELINALFYENVSMREFSRKVGIRLSSVQYQYAKILEKLKKFF